MTTTYPQNSTLTMNTTNPTSTDSDVPSDSEGYLGMIIVMFVLAICLNASALVMLITSSKRHGWSAFYRLLLALCITDSIGSLTCFPVLLVTYANGVKWMGGQPLCNYHGYMISFVFLSSASIVGLMSFERFLGIWFPFLYNDAKVRDKRSSILLASIWILAVIIASLPLLGFGEYVLQYPGTWCFYNFRSDKTSTKVYAYFYSILWICVFVWTVICNILVVAKLVRRRYVSKRAANTKLNLANHRSLRNEFLPIILLLLISLVTATCGMPMAVRAIINESGSERDNNADLNASRMVTFNLILDPLMYMFFRRENLEWVYKKFRGKKKKEITTNVSTHSSQSEGTNKTSVHHNEVSVEMKDTDKCNKDV